MPKLRNETFRNQSTVTSFGRVEFDHDGVAEVTEEALQALTTLPGWVALVEDPTGVTVIPPIPVPVVNDVVEVSDRLGNIQDLRPVDPALLPIRKVTRRRFLGGGAN